MLLSATLSSAVFILLAMSFMALYGRQFTLLEAGKTATKAQQYAEIFANTIKMTSYDEIKAQDRQAITAIPGAEGWETEVALGPEKETEDGNQYKLVTVKVYKQAELLPRYSSDVLVSSAGLNSLPIGTVIA